MLIFLALFVFLFQGGLGDLIVQTENGRVQGTSFGTPSGKTYYAWRGIPFGQPPVGNLRYLPPLKAEPWTDILDGSTDAPACIFFAGGSPPNGESEDCLYVNVYSPVPVGSNLSVNATLPVMFWIYGGGLVFGTGAFSFYDPTPFLEENVIVVTFNYRLSTLGFLSTEDTVILGNAGLKDQLLALLWTKDNIAYFGGNPDDITMFGESAGAASTGYHLASPKSRNLFKSAILESGCSLVPILQQGAREFAFTLASQFNASITNTSSSAEVLDVLQAAPLELLVARSSGNQVSAVIEAESEFSFISSPLYETAESGDISRIPLIIGHNSEESLANTNDMASLLEKATQHDLNPELLVPIMPLKDNLSTRAIGQEVHDLYAGKDTLFADNLAGYLNWDSAGIVRSCYKYAFLQSKFSPVYIYQFSYVGTLSQYSLNVPGANGRVGHGQEVGYLFNVSTNPIETELDFLTRRRFVKLWTNFAKTSNPTPDDDSAELLQNVKWEPIVEDNVQFLDIDVDLQIKPSQKLNELSFWENFFGNYSFQPYNTF